jgi:hypothetical protein
MEDLPEIVKDAEADWETKDAAVLEHLLATVRDFCGVEHGFKLMTLQAIPGQSN